MREREKELFPQSAVNHKTVTAWMKLPVGLMFSPLCLQKIWAAPVWFMGHHSESDIMGASILEPAHTDLKFMLQNTKNDLLHLLYYSYSTF